MHPDAIVVGSGPNGLTAGIILARAGLRVQMIEGRETIGGGLRTEELILPGCLHDRCAVVVPLARSSPFFRTLELERYGVDWIDPLAAAAHPLHGDDAVLVWPSLERTAAEMGEDAGAYRRLMNAVKRDWTTASADLLGPLPWPPKTPIADIRFGLPALMPAAMLARLVFRGVRARAVFAGMAAHSILPLEWPATSAFGLVLLAAAHTVGWPLVRGGTAALGEALAQIFRESGGEIVTGRWVETLDDFPEVRVMLLDLSPRAVLRVANKRLPANYCRQLARYRYGPGVCKVDWVLDGPIPWRDSRCALAGTVHLGGTLEAIAQSERLVWRGEHPGEPYIILVQPSLFDDCRAPDGMHIVWGYCHVPNGSFVDRAARIEAVIEGHAPGFGERILARRTTHALEMEIYNPNYVGGDINCGAQDLSQFFFRPSWARTPYRMPARGLYLCSSATPPGGGVHGMCGAQAAWAALDDLGIKSAIPGGV